MTHFIKVALTILTTLILVSDLASQTYKDQYGTQFSVVNDINTNGNGTVIAGPVGLATSYTITLPAGYGTNGQALQFNPGGTVWSTISGSVTPGGANTNVQFNDAGNFGGSNNLVWDDVNNRLGLGILNPAYTFDGALTAKIGASDTSGTFSLFSEQGGTDYTASMIANTSSTENVSLKFPDGDGTSDQILISDGTGQLLWVSENTVGTFPCNDGQGTGGGSNNTADGQYSFIGGGMDNEASNSSNSSFIGGGTGNTVEGDRSAIISGGTNYIGPAADQSVIGSGTYDTILGDNAMIATGRSVMLGASAHQSFIGSGEDNEIYSTNSAIATGIGNVINSNSNRAMIAVGRYNQTNNSNESVIIAGDSSNISGGARSVVGNGNFNTINATNSMIGTGRRNSITGNNSVIVAGDTNSITSANSTILGGVSNTVTGEFSMAFGLNSEGGGEYAVALGRNAEADDDGSFVFTDSTSTIVTSAANNRFTARFTSGYRFFSNSAQTAGVLLTPGSSAWAGVSDSTKKENITVLDDSSIYQKMLDLPLYTWNYIGADPSERHYGPMAQDFYALFGKDEIGQFADSLSMNNTHFASLGISALKAQKNELDKLNADLSRENERQRELLIRTQALLEKLRRMEEK